ncbi:MAG TPA: DJ-1/PfpI family protein [Puia sp.]|nr:DJ-1/PfpI family protein [Puia sp.]
MKLAYIIFDEITWLDMIGLYDAVSRLKSGRYRPDLTWDICSLKPSARDKHGLEIKATKVNQPLAEYDGIIVPGGWGTRELILDPVFMDWIRTAAPAKYKISVCTGSLILGAAGFLKGRTATTHFKEYENLKPFCKLVSTDRIVEDDNVITAGAVSSSIDLGLYLCRKWAGRDCEEDIRRQMAVERS